MIEEAGKLEKKTTAKKQNINRSFSDPMGLKRQKLKSKEYVKHTNFPF